MLMKMNLSKNHCISLETVEDSIFEWNLYFSFDNEKQISKDLSKYAKLTGNQTVKMNVIFPPDYPGHPPFIRVVHPRFHQYTGHITIGGSVCVKDLTNSGWDSKNELLPFFIMTRNLLLEGGAIIDLSTLDPYSVEEARSAFKRVALFHGWSV